MPGTSNINRERGTIYDNGKSVETKEQRRLPIYSTGSAEDTLLADGAEVSFYEHHEKGTGNMAADVREVHTKPTPSLAKAGTLTK